MVEPDDRHAGRKKLIGSVAQAVRCLRLIQLQRLMFGLMGQQQGNQR